MASRWEYEVVRLRNVPHPRMERCFRWQCRKTGDLEVGHDELEEMLDGLGAQGWQVVAHDTDGRFGSTILLMREIQETIAVAPSPAVADTLKAPKSASVYSIPRSGAAAVQMAAVAEEMRSLKDAFLQQPAPQTIVATDPSLVSAIQGMAQELKGMAERPEPPPPPAAPTIATLDPAVIERLTTVPASIQAVLDVNALRSLEETLLLAVSEVARQPQVASLDPASIQWLEGALAQARARYDDDDTPSGPPIALIDEECIARLEASLTNAAQAWQPVQATLDPAVIDAIRAATATASVDPAALQHLEGTIQAAIERLARIPGTAFLAEGTRESLAHAFRSAVENLPTPQVQAGFDPASLSELKSAISQAIAAIPAPQTITASVDPEALLRIEALLGRALQQTPSPASVTLSPDSLRHLEEAICRAVATALEPKNLPEVAPAPKPRFQWLPKMSGRLKIAFR